MEGREKAEVRERNVVAIKGKNAIVCFILLALPEFACPNRLGAVATGIPMIFKWSFFFCGQYELV